MECAKRATVRLCITVACAIGGFALAPVAFAGTTDTVTGWIWSGTVGWISMNCTNPLLPDAPTGTCATADYGVTLVDTGGSPAAANLSGYAWSENVGWICFGATCAATAPGAKTPEGVDPYAQYRALSNGQADQVWGWAKVLSLGNDGWISLNCGNALPAFPTGTCAASQYFVGINPSTGDFNPGTQPYDHFAWSGTDAGTGIGWIDFSIANTTWSAAALGTISRPPGIYEPQSLGDPCVIGPPSDPNRNCTTPPNTQCNAAISRCVLPGTHPSSFDITFTGFSGGKNDLLACDITRSDLSKKRVAGILAATVRGGSEKLTYAIAATDATATNTLWYIDACRLAGLPKATACTTDAQCGTNAICDIDAYAPADAAKARCRDVLVSSTQRRPLYVHPNTWTGLGSAAQDWYAAIKCNAGFPGNYFHNAAQCDFVGDATFAMIMSNGMPVERDCGDGIDNDGNGLIDCADPACKGISYVCTGATLPRTTCTYGQSTSAAVQDCDKLPIGSGLCCGRQPIAPGATQSSIVDGLECVPGDPHDGYYDCSCDNQTAFGANATDDCFAPGAQKGDLCCDTGGNVVKK